MGKIARYFVALLIFISLFPAPRALATVSVAFLKVYDQWGSPIHLEPNGPGYFHVAISYDGQWLHAHPWGGVQLSTDLSHFGVVDTVITHEGYNEPDANFITAVLGAPYDVMFTWGGHGYYCSELLALIFAVQPTPMRFEGEYWARYFAALGETPPQGVGVSPDQLFMYLLNLGFQHSGPHLPSSLTCEPHLVPGDRS